MAYGSRRVKSPLIAAANSFCYAEFTLKKSKGNLPAVDSADVIDSFYDLRLSLEKLELACEICRIAENTSFENIDSTAPLQFLLNTLHIIQIKPDSELQKISAFFRLRYYALLGFEIEPESLIISEHALSALDHIYASPTSRLYNAQISPQILNELHTLATGVTI
jgi:DNA repair protein RecO